MYKKWRYGQRVEVQECLTGKVWVQSVQLDIDAIKRMDTSQQQEVNMVGEKWSQVDMGYPNQDPKWGIICKLHIARNWKCSS